MKLLLACLALLAPLAAAGAQRAGPPDNPPLDPNSPQRHCRQAQALDEIVVCGQREEDEQHRLRPVEVERFDPEAGVDSVARERNALLGESTGTVGACSVAGPMGMTGCFNQGVWRSREQRGK